VTKFRAYLASFLKSPFWTILGLGVLGVFSYLQSGRVGSLGHRVNCYQVGSGHGSILLTQFHLCVSVLNPLHHHHCSQNPTTRLQNTTEREDRET